MQGLGAVGMVLVGAGVAAIAPISAGISLIRMVDSQRNSVRDRSRFRAVTLEYAYWMLLFAIVTALGLCLLVVGLVVGYGLPRWAPALPGGMVVLAAVVAGYTRWLLQRERTAR